jgi:autophagy-related protein 9
MIPPTQADRSRQGKMEKSLLSFAATYPGWVPGPDAANMLASVGPAAAPPLPGTAVVMLRLEP